MAETNLVVDDEPDVRALARDRWEPAGMSSSRPATRSTLCDWRKEQPIHLLVVDVIMPLMKGTEWPTASRP
jgi:DNA-binding response OmpR family regulator